MKVLLQDLQTLNFVERDGWTTNGWTSCAMQAFDFGQVVDALDYAIEHGLANVRAVIKCSDSRYDIELPPVRLAVA